MPHVRAAKAGTLPADTGITRQQGHRTSVRWISPQSVGGLALECFRNLKFETRNRFAVIPSEGGRGPHRAQLEWSGFSPTRDKALDFAVALPLLVLET